MAFLNAFHVKHWLHRQNESLVRKTVPSFYVPRMNQAGPGDTENDGFIVLEVSRPGLTNALRIRMPSTNARPSTGAVAHQSTFRGGWSICCQPSGYAGGGARPGLWFVEPFRAAQLEDS